MVQDLGMVGKYCGVIPIWFVNFQWLLSWLLIRLFTVVHGYKNSSICLHFFHFHPDDDWSIQSKGWQVIFRAQVGNR